MHIYIIFEPKGFAPLLFCMCVCKCASKINGRSLSHLIYLTLNIYRFS